MAKHATDKTDYDIRLVERIRKADDKAFEELFFEYYSGLCGFAMKFLKSSELAKDCVQEVLLKIWRNRENWEINASISVYLYRAVHNQALNQLEKQKNKREYTQKYYKEGLHKVTGAHLELSSEKKELIEKIWEVVKGMPARRKLVFELHRKHGLSYKEIAEVLEITRKTVEVHIGNALKYIREHINLV